jgi:hypothetical protein
VKRFDPPELQVNLLKRLPGTPLAMEAGGSAGRFNPHPPYELLASDALDFASVTRLQRFARVWELVHNRGLCPQAARALWETGGDSPSARYRALAEMIYEREGRLHALGAHRIKMHVADFLSAHCGFTPDAAADLAGI